MALNSTMVAEKWRRNTAASTQAVKEGVMAVTKSPMEAAAAQQQAYLEGVRKAAESGKWKRNLLAVPLSEWQDRMVNQGIPRIASGVEAAVPRMQAFMDQLLPYTAAISAEASKMPRGSLEDSIARMTMSVRKMAQFKFQKGR